MPRQTLAIVILGASVAALLALQVATSQRLSKLSDQIAKLEERPAGAQQPAPGPATDGAKAAPGGGSDTLGVTGGGCSVPLPENGSLSTPAAKDGSEGDTATAAGRKKSKGGDEVLTKDEVAKLIDKKLAERDKDNPFGALMKLEDPMTVMERELKLSDIQKTRIAQHWKERDDAIMEMWQSEDARKDWKATQEKGDELRKKTDESVKRELDLAQQDKYEQLKKDGKIMDFGGGGGVSFVMKAGKSKAVKDDKAEGK